MSNKLAKDKNENKVFKRNEVGLKNASPILAPILSVAMLAMIAMIVLVIVGLFNTNYEMVGLGAGVFVILGAFGVYCDTLNWIYNVEYSFEDDKFEYRYNLDSSLIPVSNSKVRVTIGRLDKFKVTSKNIIVYGEVTKHAPMQKARTYKKFKFAIVPEHVTEISEYFEQLKAL